MQLVSPLVYTSVFRHKRTDFLAALLNPLRQKPAYLRGSALGNIRQTLRVYKQDSFGLHSENFSKYKDNKKL